MTFFLFQKQRVKGTYALFLAKFWMTLAAIGVGINLILVLTLLQMAPKLKAIAQILPETPMNTHRHIQIDTLPAKGILSTNSLYNTVNRAHLDEMLIRYYIDKRNSVLPDEFELLRRWGRGGDVHRLSSPHVYRAFSKKLNDRISTLKNKKETKSVHITSIQKNEPRYVVEFNVYTLNPQEPLKKIHIQRRVASIEVAHNPRLSSYNSVASNPYGFYIKEYSESIKK